MGSLNILKAHEFAGLALQVVEQSGQSNKFLKAPPTVGTVVCPLSMGRRVEMLIQSPRGIVASVTQITLPKLAVPCLIGCFVVHILAAVPFDLLVCNKTIGIQSLNDLGNAATVHIRSIRAGASLQMVRDTARRNEFSPAKRAFDVVAAVDL